MMSGSKTIFFTLFGATGDLAYRKLIPALYNLHSLDLLEDGFKILAIGRRDYSAQDYHELLRPWCEKFVRTGFNERVFDAFLSRIEYIQMRFDNVQDYQVLKERYSPCPQSQHLYYLAVASSYFDVIASNLVESGCTTLSRTRQCLIEKPFGTSFDSAQVLNDTLLKFFKEEEIYRIDHYLGKEMIQNLLSIRFENPILTPLWHHSMIDSIVVRALEEVGVESRGQYYDDFGAIKDMVQNHLFQILSLLLMKPSNDLDERIVNQKEIIDHLTLYDQSTHDIILGQYTSAQHDSKITKGYREEEHVNPQSNTETFVSIKARVNLPDYKDIKVILQTGKRTHMRSTEVLINFKGKGSTPNQMIIKISPDEGVYLRMNIKKPGPNYDVESVMMEYCQSCVYENRLNTPEAYERLLKAAIQFDRSLFTPWEMVASSWKIVDEWLAFINTNKVLLQFYPAKTYGPTDIMEHIHEPTQ
jgi:glucose-6-phosphate 1-dehydrogenase